MAEEIRCRKITIELSNGKMLVAEGEHAELIWKWWYLTEMIATKHGATYTGPKLKIVDSEDWFGQIFNWLTFTQKN